MMEHRIRSLMDRMRRRHVAMKSRWYGAILSPVLVVLGFMMLAFGIIILPTPGPGWFTIFVSFGVLSLVFPPMRRFNIWLAMKYDLFYAWYQKQHVAAWVSMLVALVVFMVVVMGGAYYFVAPDSWPYTFQAEGAKLLGLS